MDNQQPSILQQTPNYNQPQQPVIYSKSSKKKPILIGLLVVVLLFAACFGVYAWQHGKVSDSNKKIDSLNSQLSDLQNKVDKLSKQSGGTSTDDPATNWTAYTNKNGGFSLKYPSTWATATNPDLCGDGLFMLGGNASSVGKCATEDGGQMTITWRTDRAACGDLSSDAWTQNSKESVKVSGYSATKITATAKDPGMGLGALPEGTKTVQYCFVANSTTYIADYNQLTDYPDVLADFNTMVTKTFQIN